MRLLIIYKYGKFNLKNLRETVAQIQFSVDKILTFCEERQTVCDSAHNLGIPREICTQRM